MQADRIAPGFGVNECVFACLLGSLFFSIPCGCFSTFCIYLDKPGQPYFWTNFRTKYGKSVLVGSSVFCFKKEVFIKAVNT